MATEQEPTPDDADLATLRRSAIENEIPTYRAISTRAVFAALCGVLSILSFTHPLFYLFAAAAVLLGWSAERAIRRYPDVLTGSGLARAGIGMGLVFGLSIFTVTTVQHFLTTRQAAAFAAEYAGMLKTRPLEDLYWIQLNPEARATVTPEENLKQMQASLGEAASMTDMKFAGLRKLAADLRASDQNTIAFEGIETLGKEEITVVAIARFNVHIAKPPHEGHAEGEGQTHEDHAEGPTDSHAMAVIKAITREGKHAYEWWVEDVTYPYEPQSAVLPEKAVDDGHGHAH